ncbi:GAF domain-containing protein [Reichenbachiella faecimaris]|uniref:GAF domain-containing protein n=1 Tax=Reichenbachiella faecimaris TaxID=692418 RepID=A0A1W2G575_REIFA|nr:GAF domain-containing protein [Reichenbachiella faecimaris]SMD31741.1 GAF domain-containing protein [Reichenbachiella faecimaris]
MRWLNMTDYKIQSNKVFFSVLIVNLMVSGIMVIVDLTVDLRSGSIIVYTSYFVASLAVTLLSIRFAHATWIRFLMPLLIFILIEFLFLAQPQTFNTTIYWFPFIPILAVLIQGLQASRIWFIIILVSYLFNFLIVLESVGSTYNLLVSSSASYWSGVVFLGAILASTYLLYNLLGEAYSKTVENNQELTNLKNSVEQKSLQLTAFNAALIELTRNPEAFKTTKNLFENVCALAQDSLEVDRVSIWLFNTDRNILELKYLVENGSENTKEIVISQVDYPSYFEAVETKPYIMAHNAISNPDTSEFKDNYLAPLGIKSMLDCPILLDQKAIGVVCCEHIRNTRKWEAEHALITQSLADFIASHYKNKKIKELLNTLKSQNKELSLSSTMIESMNKELHQLNEKLIESNGSLEAAVDKRTQKLLIQNNQLKEYAFVNSHMLRAPLSSILGISNLLQIHNTSIQDEELLKALHESTKNLDEIVRKISSTLEDGSNLTRKDIDYIINKRFKNSEIK